MLVKELCIKCYNQCRTRPWEKQATKERLWKRGLVCCPVAMDYFDKGLSKRFYHKIKDPPPEGCRYVLEHLLLSQEK